MSYQIVNSMPDAYQDPLLDPKEQDNGGFNTSARSSLSSILENISRSQEKDSDFVLEPTEEDSDAEEFDDTKDPEHIHPIHRKTRRRVKFISAGVIFALLVMIFVSVISSTTHKNAIYTSPSVKKIVDLAAVRAQAFAPQYKRIRWISPASNSKEVLGDYQLEEHGKFYLSQWANKSYKKTILDTRIISYDDKTYVVESLVVGPDHTKAILGTNLQHNWRHSTFGAYFILDIDTGSIEPVYNKNASAELSFAHWSPRGDNIAFVLDNNLYLRSVGGANDIAGRDVSVSSSSGDLIRQITFDGGEQLFYGRPDWVYEEEVFAQDSALWWSPTGDYLAFLRTNDTSVPEFPIPYFVQKGNDGKNPYPDLRQIKYPKPGYDNPIVEVLFLDISSGKYFDVPIEGQKPDDLVTEVVWTDTDKVILRITTRESDYLKVAVVDAKSKEGKIVRTEDAKGQYGGWFEVQSSTTYIPASDNHEEGYIDTVVVDGYNHMAFFSPVEEPEPKVYLTSGKWEVVDAPTAFDKATDTVYFMATKKDPTERHLYSVQLDGTGFKSITNTSADGYYSVSFSYDTRYILLTYAGPDVPWQKVLDVHSDNLWEKAESIEDNSKLRSNLENYNLPTFKYSQIKLAVDEETGEDIVGNAVEILPPKFNPKKQYPVLFYVYGGPVSQNVAKTFSYSFQATVAGSLNAVVVTVDGRGTGFMGRKFRSVVRDNLGYYEVQDQITAADIWRKKDYIDSSRVAIWGWSYGGFMTLKTLETDAGEHFKYGMAVAPVTNWRYYDSIYTERYMHTPQNNPQGYETSAVRNGTAISQCNRFLLMHGTGDDNVHFQNSLSLLDIFDQQGVENYDVHIFPDSDHSIRYNNANNIVYDKLSHWIDDAFSGKFKSLE